MIASVTKWSTLVLLVLSTLSAAPISGVDQVFGVWAPFAEVVGQLSDLQVDLGRPPVIKASVPLKDVQALRQAVKTDLKSVLSTDKKGALITWTGDPLDWTVQRSIMTKAQAHLFLQLKQQGWRLTVSSVGWPGKRYMVTLVCTRVYKTAEVLAKVKQAVQPVSGMLQSLRLRHLGHGSWHSVMQFRVPVKTESAVTALKKTLEKSPPQLKKDTRQVCKGTGAAFKEPGFDRSGEAIKVTLNYRQELMTKKFAETLQAASAVPKRAGKKMLGYELNWIAEGSFYCKAGFLPGDVVTHIQETPLNDPSKAIQFLQSLQGLKKVTVDLLRGKQKVRKTIEILN